MGNTPSKEPQARHKLSKPRVSSFQTTASPASTSQRGAGPKRATEPALDFMSVPYTATSSNSNIVQTANHDPNDSQQDSDKTTPLIAAKAQRRLSLFRPKSSQEPSARRPTRRNTIIGSPAVLSHGDFGAVTRGTSVSTHQPLDQWHRGLPLPVNENWPIADDRSSWAYDLSSYEAQRVLSMVQDQSQPLRRSQTSTSLANSRPDFMARRRATMFVQPQSAPISRSASEISLHPPMRRRSIIQTPGVATRPCPNPNPARSTRSSVRHSHPPTPSISRQPSTHFEESEKHLSLPTLSFLNAMSGETSYLLAPQDTDYSITGAYKFGTLRITNGSPVLTPNPDITRARDDGQPELDVQDPVKPQRQTETTSREQATELIKAELDLEQNSPKLESIQPTNLLTCSLEGQEACKPLAHSDLMETRPASSLMIQSRQAAVDDHLFDDEEILDVRVDLSARSFPSNSTEVSEGVNRSDSGFVSSSKSNSSQSRSSLAKADSGYSSNVSVRSLRHGKKLAPSEEEIDRQSSDSNRASGSAHPNDTEAITEAQVSDSPAVDQRQAVDTHEFEQGPTPPPKDDPVVMQRSVNHPGVDDLTTALSAPGTAPKQFLHHQPTAIDTNRGTERQELVSPTSLPLSPASAHSEGSSSSLSIGNSVQRPGRLQRFLSLKSSPFSKQPYTVHVTHSVDNAIPSIPKEVEAKLRERTGLYPMTTKRLALKSQMSKETLKTILSVGSLEYASEDQLSHSPMVLDEDAKHIKSDESGEPKDKTLKHTLSSMQSNFKTAAASMMFSRKQVARKPVPTQESEEASVRADKDEIMLPAELGLTSYRSISSTLGNNAYDSAARALSPPRPRRTMSMSSGHEHYAHLRTFSLPSSDGSKDPASSSTTCSGQLPPKRKTSPPISMITRPLSFRTPPPRSPISPQGPVVLPRKSQEKASRSMSHSAALAAGHRLGQHATSRSRPPPSASHVYANARVQYTRQDPSASRTGPALPGSRHSSISSVHSDLVRDSLGRQANISQHAQLKYRASLDGVDRNQLIQALYGPDKADQKPPHERTLSSHRDWRSPGISSMPGGQHSWEAPPYVLREPHRRNLSVDSRPNHLQSGAGQAPYRILHSYNSPAYRNAPIWG